MTINVVSTTDKPAENPVEKKDETPSALEAKTSEQNKALDSETKETEEKEKIESKDESESDEDNDESNDSEEEKPRKKGGFQRRIDKLNAAKAAAERDAEHWKQMALKGAGEPKPESKVETKVEVTGKPNPENFETHADYVEALTDWKIEQRELSKKQDEEKSKLLNEQEKIQTTHFERVNAFSKKTPDWNEVLADADDVQLSAAAIQVIQESEVGPEIIYELAKNKKEAMRIASLSPLIAAKEIGKIEAKFSSKSSEETKPEPKKITKAPQPIAPVGASGGNVSKSIYDPGLSQKEYEELRAKMRA